MLDTRSHDQKNRHYLSVDVYSRRNRFCTIKGFTPNNRGGATDDSSKMRRKQETQVTLLALEGMKWNVALIPDFFGAVQYKGGT